jgi:lipopolysaccharide transport system ATP-binding protein
LALEDVTPDESPEFCFSFPLNIGPGNYSVSLSLSCDDSHVNKNYEWTDRALIFHVMNPDEEDFYGTCWLNAEIQVRRGGAGLMKEEAC